MKKVKIIIFSILLIISTAVVGLFHLVAYVDRIDPEYAVSVFEESVETREFDFSEFSRLYFLDDSDPLTSFSKNTLMLGATPVLNIVNSTEYRVEIRTNSDVFDALKVATHNNPETNKSSLVITFADECYVPVYTDDSDYDYDTGLYVNFDVFEVTVYAPITSLSTNSELMLDYQAPMCDEMYVSLSYYGTRANIYDIDAYYLDLYCCGSSNATLSGKVRNTAKIMVCHDSKLNAENLEIKRTDFYVSSSFLFGFSYIKHGGTYHFADLREYAYAIILSAMLYLPPFIWLICLLCCLLKKSTKKRPASRSILDMKLIYKIIIALASEVIILLILPLISRAVEGIYLSFDTYLILIFAVNPIASAAINLLVGKDIKTLFWFPVMFYVLFALFYQLVLGERGWDLGIYYLIISIFAMLISYALARARDAENKKASTGE